MKEIEKEINQVLNIEFDYDKTDRYIVINVGEIKWVNLKNT